jgi:ligand-binding SRPBCC domain-containing protein
LHLLEREQVLSVEPAQAFEFFADPFNLESITPAWLNFRIDPPAPIEIGPGTLIRYRLRLHGVPVRWLTRIEAWDPGHRFEDVQLRGPYRLWHHSHTFCPHERGTLMRDRVHYALPLGVAGLLANRAFVRRDLDRIFAFRALAVSERLRQRFQST